MSREDIDLVANSEDAVRIILLTLQNYSATYRYRYIYVYNYFEFLYIMISALSAASLEQSCKFLLVGTNHCVVSVLFTTFARLLLIEISPCVV